MYKRKTGPFETGPNTPLHFAIEGMHVACVRELLAAGATMLHFDDYGNGAYGNGLMCSACKTGRDSQKGLQIEEIHSQSAMRLESKIGWVARQSR